MKIPLLSVVLLLGCTEEMGEFPVDPPEIVQTYPGDPIPAGVEIQETASGLRYAMLREGDGETPSGPEASVTIRYTGWLASNGQQFDSSGETPRTWPLGGLIPGWIEGLQLVRTGGKVKLLIPWDLAYGERGHPAGIPGKADLVFDVELVATEG